VLRQVIKIYTVRIYIGSDRLLAGLKLNGVL